MKRLLKTVIALMLLAMAYYFGVWGSFGLNLGEANYRRAGEYRMMLAGGIVCGVTGVFLLISAFSRIGGRTKQSSPRQ